MTKRLSETAADSSSAFSLFKCISSVRYLNRLKFFSTINHELDRIKSERESPEIIALVADWGQGKSFFLDIIKEYSNSSSIAVIKENFSNVLENWIPNRDGILLIDEVENLVDSAIFGKYKEKIRDFWINIKTLANSKGNSIIYLSMTPSAYSKIFSVGGQLQLMFQETFPALVERVKKVTLNTPSKLEFLLMLNCSMKLRGFDEEDLISYLKYMDLPFWVTQPERRKYVRLINEVIMDNFPSVENTFQEISRGPAKSFLNDEEETVREKELLRLEDEIDRSDRVNFYKSLMCRVGIDKSEILEPLKYMLVKGNLVPYSKWIQVTSDSEVAQNLEDFLLTVKKGKDLEDSLYIFISEELEKLVYEGIISDFEELEAIKEKVLPLANVEAYAMRWDFYEKIVNTNVGGLIVDFKTREMKDMALRFVNDNLTDNKKLIESIINFIDIGKQEWKVEERGQLSLPATLIQLTVGEKKINLMLAIPTSHQDTEKIIEKIKSSQDIIHSLLLINNEFVENNMDDIERLVKITNNLSITMMRIDVPTPMKRQLLYMLFAKKTMKNINIRYDALEIKLGELKRNVEKCINESYEKLIIPQLPAINKRLIQSFNWILFYPEDGIAEVKDIFEKTNDVVNQRFRIFGSKQFHLEDFETETVLEKEIVPYLTDNEIIRSKEGFLDYSNLYGETINKISTILAGYLKQRIDDYVNPLVNFFISSSSTSPDEKFLNTIAKLLQTKNDQSLLFLVYVSVISGLLVSKMDKEKIIDAIIEKINQLPKKEVNDDYFITAKRRDAGIRSLSEMRNIMEKYRELCMLSKENVNNLRFCASYIALNSIYSKLSATAEESRNKMNNEIEIQILKKVDTLVKARKFLGINEPTEEEKIIEEILNNIRNIKNIAKEISDTLKEIYENNKGEEFKRSLDEVVSAIGMDEDQPIHLGLFIANLTNAVLDGVRTSIIDYLNKVDIFNMIQRVKGSARVIKDIDVLLDSLNKTMPELPLIKEEKTKVAQEIEDTVSKIRERVKEIEG
ncbi:hypothetical protein [Sulfuracidifex metallicus]|uniref:hypothetical protein n=1 Tax=Sulfuracidifex metallicus TaxID=47303 RepID=UPI002275B04F|nr:hypothetical protein [Sulfuracidifex metallicus]MCY0849383.1 hypothetical protein [Sulfuracidifex metallicus]